MKDIFCKIIDKELPSYMVYENEAILAFLDIEPVSKGHTLIIPKKHYNDISDISIEDAKSIMEVAVYIARAIKSAFKYDGVILKQVNGDALQDIRHFHLHVYGVNKSQENYYYKKISSEPESRDKDFEAVAKKLREGLKKIFITAIP